MAPVEGRNVRSMFITSCLAVIFGLKIKKLLLQPAPHEILAMPLFRLEYTAIAKMMLNRATLVKVYSNEYVSFAGTVNLALVPFTCLPQCFFVSLF